MNCAACGKPMTTARENYSYTASGLPQVTLARVEVRRCKACGEHEVVIPRIEQLHRVIARAVIGKRSRLTAAETRFLRKYLGWSGADFARHMGVTAESVSRWENNREKMGPVADRLLRLMVANKAPVSEYPIAALAELQEKPSPLPMRVHAEPAKGGWRVAPVAA
jgi:putative zinc finger/helix-turn-helix YgiT family protein